MPSLPNPLRHGGCHCGAVRFEFVCDDPAQVLDCNCSMCAKTGYLHLIVPKEDFKLLTSPDALTTYTFNTGAAKHTFCKTCGIKSFYYPRSHPDGVSVNVRCIDDADRPEVVIEAFDGKNWEAARERL